MSEYQLEDDQETIADMQFARSLCGFVEAYPLTEDYAGGLRFAFHLPPSFRKCDEQTQENQRWRIASGIKAMFTAIDMRQVHLRVSEEGFDVLFATKENFESARAMAQLTLRRRGYSKVA